MRFWECRWKSSSRHGTTGHEIAFSEAKSRTAEGEIHFAAFRLPAPQSDQYPRCATRFPGRLERLSTGATDQKSFLAFAIAIFVRVFIGVHAPMGVVVVVTEDLVEENAEAMFLCVI